MNKDKEPLLSASEFYDAIIDMSNIPREHWQNEIIDFMDNYANYKTEWHLRQCSEVVCEEAECEITKWGYVAIVDKQSITNAVENYINESL